MKICVEHPEHGYWPVVHHPVALLFAKMDVTKVLDKYQDWSDREYITVAGSKHQRMIDGRCLICGGETRRVA